MTNFSPNPSDAKQAALLKFLYHYLGIGFVLEAADLDNTEIIQSLGEGDMPGAIRHASIAMKQANAERGVPAGGRSEQNDPQ